MSSRVARKPISIPSGINVNIQQNAVTIKGSKGELVTKLPHGVMVNMDNQEVLVSAKENVENSDALAGTIRALLNNNVIGVSQGFSKKLQLVGVGYRVALATGKDGAVLNLTLGLSHPVSYSPPAGITMTVPNNTEIEVSGVDKQVVGQAAADIRSICGGIREPEPYKGKGIRYFGEVIKIKETKKK
jgi:large subunit ribosomal protein L6